MPTLSLQDSTMCLPFRRLCRKSWEQCRVRYPSSRRLQRHLVSERSWKLPLPNICHDRRISGGWTWGRVVRQQMLWKPWKKMKVSLMEIFWNLPSDLSRHRCRHLARASQMISEVWRRNRHEILPKIRQRRQQTVRFDVILQDCFHVTR